MIRVENQEKQFRVGLSDANIQLETRVSYTKQDEHNISWQIERSCHISLTNDDRRVTKNMTSIIKIYAV